MTSLRVKLPLVAAVLFAGGIGLLLLANALFLEPFFALQTQGTFEDLHRILLQADADLDSLTRTTKGLASGTGFKISVVDSEGSVIVSSVPEFQVGQRFPLPRDQLQSFRDHRAGLDGGQPVFGILDVPAPGQAVIQLLAALGPQRYLVITQPLDHLRRNMVLASQFFLLVGSLILVLEFLVILVLSRRLVRPILDLAQVARAVAAQDFGVRYRSRRDDELGILGESLNAMAGTLARKIDELTAANAALARQVEAQEAFIAGASHELKTPVGLVRGYAEALGMDLGAEAERAEWAQIILKEADHLDRLVRDLTRIAALTTQPGAVLPAPGDLAAEVVRAAGRFQRTAAENRIDLAVRADRPSPAEFDPDRIVQVVDNLLSNALRHTPAGGRIDVRVFGEAGQVRLEVENTGPSVLPEHLPHLFEPFYRADPSRSRDSGGLGLGLSLVRGIVQAHGGAWGARATSAGMLFWVAFPSPREGSS